MVHVMAVCSGKPRFSRESSGGEREREICLSKLEISLEALRVCWSGALGVDDAYS